MFQKNLSGVFGSLSLLHCSQPSFHDSLFDVTIPRRILKQDLFSTAHRCMHDVCWFPPARAYVVGLFLDTAAVNRLKTHPDAEAEYFETHFPKSFVLYFASSKDAKHIRNGFARSFENFARNRKISESTLLMNRFLSVLDGHAQLHKGDFFRITCNPTDNTVVVNFSDEQNNVTIRDAQILIEWIHWLYLGLPDSPARYKSIHEKLTISQV